jgi:NTP pyrophosphatase (non-canonical NTP hydrolase)
MKVMEELGETAGAIAKNKATAEIMDGIGDTFVTLIILSYQLGLEPSDCLEACLERN